MSLLLSVILTAAVPPALPCTLIRPVAPDEAAARRIAEAVIANVPPSQRLREATAAGARYRLIVKRDPDDPHLWIAFQGLPPPPRSGRRDRIVLQAPGHGLGFRIDRCTGAISQMAYQR